MPKPKFRGGGKTKTGVVLEGVDELERALQELGEDVKAVLTEAAQDGAEVVLAEARRKAPRRTGNLASNLESKPSGKVKNSAARTVGPNRDAWYGVQVELGHNVVRGGEVVGHVPAQPYLRPALLESAAKVEEIIGRAFARALSRF